MARSFDGSTQYLEYAGNAAQLNASDPFSMFCWAYPVDTATPCPLLSIYLPDFYPWNHVLALGGDNSPFLAVPVLAQSSAYLTGPFQASIVNAYSANRWVACGGVWANQSSRQVYANGVPGTPDTNNVNNPYGPNTTGIGTACAGPLFAPPRTYANCPIAEAAVWNVALTDAEMLALAKGVKPYLIRPKNLFGYWPLHGLQSPEADRSGKAQNMILTAAPPSFNHAPLVPFTIGKLA